MTEKLRKHGRILWGLFIAGLAFAFVTLMGQQSLSFFEISNAAKRQKVESLYEEHQAEFTDTMDVTPLQAMRVMADQKAVFIDIREPIEQQVSMLPKSITKDEFISNSSSYMEYVKIAYGTIGERSGKFAQIFQNAGIPVYNLRGGILAWVHDRGKVYDHNGETQRIHVFSRNWNLVPAQFEAVW